MSATALQAWYQSQNTKHQQQMLYAQLMQQAQNQINNAITQAFTTGSSTTTSNTLWFSPGATGTLTSTTVPQHYTVVRTDPLDMLGPLSDLSVINLDDKLEHKLILADGTIIYVEKDGSFKIDDKNAKTVYRGCPTRDFNSYINASDKLEEFIKYCGEVGVKQGDMFGLPLELFIKWLVIEAARADGEKTDVQVNVLAALPDYSVPRCDNCGRFIRKKMKEAKMFFCGPKCFGKKQKKVLAISCTAV